MHALAGAAVWAGSLPLLVPAPVGWYQDRADRDSHALFGALWLAGIVAAALGNYPTPLVGYGSSAIIGYLLALLALPTLAGVHAGATSAAYDDAATTPQDGQLLVGVV